MQASYRLVRLGSVPAAEAWLRRLMRALPSDQGRPSVVVIRCMSDRAAVAEQRAESVAGVLGRTEHLGTQQPGELKFPVALVKLPDTK